MKTFLDGRQLIGFLAGVGALRLLDRHAAMNGGTRPSLFFDSAGYANIESNTNNVVDILMDGVAEFATLLGGAISDAKKPVDLTEADLRMAQVEGELARVVAGLVCVIGDDAFESTLCAANGASHQNLLQAMRDIAKLTQRSHVEKAISSPWTREFTVPPSARGALDLGTRKPTLRFEPADERLYAHRLTNPTTTDDFKTEIGGQALAMCGLPLFPVVPMRRPVTIASQRKDGRVRFSWYLWSVGCCLDAVRSIVCIPRNHDEKEMRRRGCFESHSVDRVSGAKGKLSFSPATGRW